MGGNTSRTRKITIENDNAANVIKVSDDVVERLKGKQSMYFLKLHTSTK